MTQKEKKVHDLIKKLRETIEKDPKLVEKFTHGPDDERFNQLDDGCYYVKVPGNGTFKICP